MLNVLPTSYSHNESNADMIFKICFLKEGGRQADRQAENDGARDGEKDKEGERR